MSDEREKAIRLLSLPDEEYAGLQGDRMRTFQAKFRELFDAPDDAPLGAPLIAPAVLAIGAPKKADPDPEKEIPILIGLRYTRLRAWEADFEQNALMVGVDLRTGQVYSGWPLLDDKRRPTPEPSRSGPQPKNQDALVTNTGVVRVDLRRALEGDWGATRLALTMLVYDWVSNTVVIDLTKPGQEAAAPAPRAASALLTRSKPGGAVPKLAGPGAALQVPTDVNPGDPVLVGGAVDLPAEESATIPSAAPEGGSLLVVSVVFRKLDEGRAVQADLAVPARIADGRVRADFEFDARRALPKVRLSGVYQVYLFTGVRAFGPFEMKVEVR